MRFEARTYFSSGGRGYGAMGMERERLIAELLVQFECYLNFAQGSTSICQQLCQTAA
ncbi:hypothetical protein CHELA1G11_20430 [Hyphomicrobiales bacterium]|nr:hypothetical protein CHELA1G11_20430 [Hyphomicrobiales bacterium]CAH1690175.1 hypothetical protein CHELA1G2_20743 [Hyphomicrobiales bacterium]